MNGKSACKRPLGLQNLKLPKKAHQERAQQQREKKENEKKENHYNSGLLLQHTEMKGIKNLSRFHNQLPMIIEENDVIDEHHVFHFANSVISFVFYFFVMVLLFVFACFILLLF